tara:strand:- start:83 stop:388 length:306 start_codon:yes stop_codon:yes gene_type:complete
MAKLTGEEVLATQVTYLIKEIAKHENDIATAQGKVQENKELLERVQNTCLYCGEYIYVFREEDRMGVHISNRHPEEVVPVLPVDYMGEERKEESERTRFSV